MKRICINFFFYFILISVLMGCGKSTYNPYLDVKLYEKFNDPELIIIQGYVGDVSEPHISPSGDFLFFSNRSDGISDSKIYFARRLNENTFSYQGRLKGVNASGNETSPSIDRNGNFYFTSHQYRWNTETRIFQGNFTGEEVIGSKPVRLASLEPAKMEDFDVEITNDSSNLYYVTPSVEGQSYSANSDLAVAERKGRSFRRKKNSELIMENINTLADEYSPAMTDNELELFFVRDGGPFSTVPTIFRAERDDASEPFKHPKKVTMASGRVGGPSLSKDGQTLYFHKAEGNQLRLFTITRSAQSVHTVQKEAN